MQKRRHEFFIAGTDTEVGKTTVASALLYVAKEAGMSTLGLKPVAAGAEFSDDTLVNEDALKLMKYSSVSLAYQQVNPVCLREPIAPHIAAEREKKRLSADRIVGFCRGSLMQSAEFSLVEGAGGWRVPLNHRESMADIARSLALPVILVVGMRLGCLNHALLTAEAIRRDGCQLAGWIGVQLDKDMAVYQENIQSVAERLGSVHLAQIPFYEKPSVESLATHLDINKIVD